MVIILAVYDVLVSVSKTDRSFSELVYYVQENGTIFTRFILLTPHWRLEKFPGIL